MAKKNNKNKYIGIITGLVVIIVLLVALNLSYKQAPIEKSFVVPELSEDLSDREEVNKVTADAASTLSEIKSLLTNIDQTLSLATI